MMKPKDYAIFMIMTYMYNNTNTGLRVEFTDGHPLNFMDDTCHIDPYLEFACYGPDKRRRGSNEHKQLRAQGKQWANFCVRNKNNGATLLLFSFNSFKSVNIDTTNVNPIVIFDNMLKIDFGRTCNISDINKKDNKKADKMYNENKYGR